MSQQVHHISITRFISLLLTCFYTALVGPLRTWTYRLINVKSHDLTPLVAGHAGVDAMREKSMADCVASAVPAQNLGRVSHGPESDVGEGFSSGRGGCGCEWEGNNQRAG